QLGLSVRTRSQPRRQLGSISRRSRGEESVPCSGCRLNGRVVARGGKTVPRKSQESVSRSPLKGTFTTRAGQRAERSPPHSPSTIDQLRNGSIAEVSGWGIDGAPTGIRTALALSLGLRPFAFASQLMAGLEPHCCTVA